MTNLYDNVNQDPQETVPFYTPPPAGQPATGGPPSTSGSPEFEFPAFHHYSNYQFGDAPGFEFRPFDQQFSAPTLEDMQNTPGYQFARDEGLGALQASAAAKGLLRGGGSLKDLAGWANKFAEQNYQSAFDRAVGTYQQQIAGYNTDLNRAWQMYQSQYNPWALTTQLGAQQAMTNANLHLGAWQTAYNNNWAQYVYEHPQPGGGGG